MRPTYRAGAPVPATLAIAAALAAAASLAATLAGCAPVPRVPKPIRPIDRASLPAGCPKDAAEVELFKTDIKPVHEQIATVDSFPAVLPDENTVKAQLVDLQTKAGIAGADAVVRVRQLKHRTTGFVRDPTTPFAGVRQGDTLHSFFRGTAVRYLEPPAARRP